MSENVRVDIYNPSFWDAPFEGEKSPQEMQAWLTSLLKGVPGEFHGNVRFAWRSTDDGGYLLEVFYTRPETAMEAARRLKSADFQAAQREGHERAELARLKAKYEQGG